MPDLEVPTTEALADWIECSVLVAAGGGLGVDKLVQLADAEVGVTASKVSMALRALNRRANILADAYPYAVNDVAVLRRDTPLGWPYAALLLLTPDSPARQTIRSSETHEMGELFEDLSEAALSNFFGAGGKALRFGHPSRHGRPPEFDQAIAWLARQMGLEPGRGYRPPRRKDGGVDVVAWRPFNDKRPGFPIALAQCTIQRETFTKTSDVDARLWASWLAMDVDPLSLLVLPGTIRSAGPDWGQLSTVVTVIDRLRLIELLGRDETDHSLPSAWTQDTIGGLRSVMRAGEQ